MRKRHFIGAAVFVIAFLGWALLYHPRPHPSDAALINYFHSNRTDFDRLVSLALEDGSVRAIYPNAVIMNDYRTWPESTPEGFSIDRWNEYKGVFARLGEYRINSVRNKFDQIQIPASSDSSDLDNLEAIVIVKGYVFSIKEPAPLLDSLDEMGFHSKGTYYRRIDQHWYLYHEWGISKPE